MGVIVGFSFGVFTIQLNLPVTWGRSDIAVKRYMQSNSLISSYEYMHVARSFMAF